MLICLKQPVISWTLLLNISSNSRLRIAAADYVDSPKCLPSPKIRWQKCGRRNRCRIYEIRCCRKKIPRTFGHTTLTSKLAELHLSSSTSSVPVERMFSSAGANGQMCQLKNCIVSRSYMTIILTTVLKSQLNIYSWTDLKPQQRAHICELIFFRLLQPVDNN